MHDEQGISFRDIAKEMGKSKSWAQRAYEKACARRTEESANTDPFDDLFDGSAVSGKPN